MINWMKQGGWGLSVVCVFLFLAGCAGRPMTDAEKTMMVQVKDLAEFGITFVANEETESFKHTNWGQGESDFNYEYESPADNEDISPLYLSSTVEFFPSDRKAKSGHLLSVNALKAGMKISGIKSVKAPELYDWGDQVYAAFLEIEGEKIGNLIVVRKGKRVYSFMISGVYFDQKEDLVDLLNPKLIKMATYGKKKK